MRKIRFGPAPDAPRKERATLSDELDAAEEAAGLAVAAGRTESLAERLYPMLPSLVSKMLVSKIFESWNEIAPPQPAFPFPRCPACKKEMAGPRFDPRHREPDRTVVLQPQPLCVAKANCYYECESCETRIVFDPLWEEMVRE